MKIYISRNPEKIGGGVNTFSRNIVRWVRRRNIRLVSQIELADRAIIFAHMEESENLLKAKKNGVRIVHRLDEDFEQNDSPHRIQKHEKIIELNRFADVTVFQSVFVKDNVYPHIQPKSYRVIYNGADPRLFRSGKKAGTAIGHVTWSAAPKKRLDILCELIHRHSNERFILVGRHETSDYDFSHFPNVDILGPLPHSKMPAIYRKMKMLLIPSERDPCPNTVVEAINSGVPVCYNPSGGIPELVKNCGVEMDRFTELLQNLKMYRKCCMRRNDLDFNRVAQLYLKI